MFSLPARGSNLCSARWDVLDCWITESDIVHKRWECSPIPESVPQPAIGASPIYLSIWQTVVVSGLFSQLRRRTVFTADVVTHPSPIVSVITRI